MKARYPLSGGKIDLYFHSDVLLLLEIIFVPVNPSPGANHRTPTFEIELMSGCVPGFSLVLWIVTLFQSGRRQTDGICVPFKMVLY